MARFILFVVFLFSAFTLYAEQVLFYYVVHKGDTLIKISEKYGVSVEEIHKLNPQMRNSTRVYVGQVLRLDGSVPPVIPVIK